MEIQDYFWVLTILPLKVIGKFIVGGGLDGLVFLF